MEIVVESLLEGARRAVGHVVVIDVFRAFTTAAVAFANGASHATMVASAEEALAMRASGIGQICLGEVGGVAPAGFDFGNSPLDIQDFDFAGKSIIQRTSAGTQGIVAAAQNAAALYAGSLVTARATVRTLLADRPERVTLVAMGNEGVERSDEDELCVLHLRNLLEGRPGDGEAVRRVILAGREARRFRERPKPQQHPGDVDIALDIDRFDFAIRVRLEQGRPVARPYRS
jgi:2-phosphosulfolactate phosphatase